MSWTPWARRRGHHGLGAKAQRLEGPGRGSYFDGHPPTVQTPRGGRRVPRPGAEGLTPKALLPWIEGTGTEAQGWSTITSLARGVNSQAGCRPHPPGAKSTQPT